MCRTLLGLVCAAALQAQITEKSFETQVLPVLRANCLACHSDKTINSGLSLETRDSILKGGNRGAVVVPGTPDKSLLIEVVRQTGAVKMPPGRKLKDEQIAILEQWVKDGLPMPAAMQKSKRPGLDHWAFQPPKRAAVPPGVHAVDHFVRQKLQTAGLKQSPEADRATLLRRVSLDLTGLPPTTKELETFLADKNADAYDRAVDRLLASPHYGERWGRHWLDIARYADSDGYTIDAPREMWPYRDWVINALNKDQPFDRFVVEQVAGDMLPNPTQDQLIATGFHRNTPSNFEGGIDFEQYRVEAVADRVMTTGSAFLGLTLGCARCHDHKYDPVSQREFYQIFAYLNNVDEVDKEADRKFFNKPFLEIGTPEQIVQSAAHQAQLAALEDELKAYREALPEDKRRTDPGAKYREGNLRRFRGQGPKLVKTLVMKELPAPRESYIHLGGDFTRKGAAVTAGTLAVMPPAKGKSRLDFAEWLVSRDNPLTARVTVNRMWQKLFGHGIVDTESDFGVMGEKPSHPELLDWLALEFMDRGWSQKAILRTIVTSATYKQASEQRPDAKSADPDNRLLARQSRLRLDAEIVRDAALQASGLLSTKVGGPSVYPPLPPGANAVTQVKREWPVSKGPDRYRRGIYTYFQRSAPHPGLVLFDAPDATVTCTRRIRSNSPLQALTLLNDEAYFEFAEVMADSVLKAPAEDTARLRQSFLAVLNRPPAESEQARLIRLLKAQRDSGKADKAAWTAAMRVLLNLDEFMTRE